LAFIPARNCRRLTVGEGRGIGREFQTIGAAKQKLRVPRTVLVRGLYRSPFCAERVTRRPGIPAIKGHAGTSEVGWAGSSKIPLGT
jgi:hypothetical protein